MSIKGSVSRRVLLLMGIAANSAPVRQSLATPNQSESTIDIIQPDIPGPDVFIERAFDMKRLAIQYGDQPYGAVIVKQNRIVGQSWSKVVINQDPTAHAEIAAIRDAAARLKSHRLDGCVLYSSSRPCPMCEAAAYWSDISHMIHGKSGTDAGKPLLCTG